MKKLMIVGALLAIAGCKNTAPRVSCTTDAQCTTPSTPGICVVSQHACAVADSSCPSGYHYIDSAMNGQCVPPSTGDMGDMSISDMSSPHDLIGADLKGADLRVPVDMAKAPDLARNNSDFSVGWVARTDGDSTAQYLAVFGSSSTGDVYVVGGSGQGHDFIHYASGTGLQGSVGNSALFTVWCNSAGNAWTGDGVGDIYQFVSGTTTPEKTVQGAGIKSIWGFGVNTLLAVDQESQLLYTRGSNGTWTSAANGGVTTINNALWGTSTTNLYIVGYTGSATPVIEHSTNGSTFTAQTVPTSLSTQPNAIWGSSATDLYVVGTSGVILHSADGSTWVQQASNTTNDLEGVFGNSSTNVFAAGRAGTILHSTGTGTWTPVTIPTTNDLHGVWVAADGEVWAVGDSGTIIHGAP